MGTEKSLTQALFIYKKGTKSTMVLPCFLNMHNGTNFLCALGVASYVNTMVHEFCTESSTVPFLLNLILI